MSNCKHKGKYLTIYENNKLICSKCGYCVFDYNKFGIIIENKRLNNQ